MLFSAMAAYAFNRISFKARVYWCPCLSLIVFTHTILLYCTKCHYQFPSPWWQLFALSCYIAMVFPGNIHPKEYFSAIPTEMDESARIDGASHAQILAVAANSNPEFATAAFSQHFQYGTSSLALYIFKTGYEDSDGWDVCLFRPALLICHAVCRSQYITIPMILVYFCLTRYCICIVGVPLKARLPAQTVDHRFIMSWKDVSNEIRHHLSSW